MSIVVVRQSYRGGALRVRVRDNKLELSRFRIERANLPVAPAGDDCATRPSNANAIALKIRHL